MPWRTLERPELTRAAEAMELPVRMEALTALAATGEPLAPDEVLDVYLPLMCFLSADMRAVKRRRRELCDVLGLPAPASTYVLAIGGSVAVGKSTTARVLRALLGSQVRTALVTTDGFLRPNAWLAERGIMDRKGWPESYDVGALLRFLAQVRAGEGPLEVPRYSHIVYDVVPGDSLVVDRPDVLILEGLNVLQVGHGEGVYVTDFCDRTLYVHADEADLERWYVDRFMQLRATVFTDPHSHFRRYADLTDDEAMAKAQEIWRSINLPNLQQNIGPTRARADVVLDKGPDHRIRNVRLRGI